MTLGFVCVALTVIGYAIGTRTPASPPTQQASASPEWRSVASAKPDAPKRVRGATNAPTASYADLAERADAGDRESAVALAELVRPCAMRAMLDSEALQIEALLDPDSPSRAHFTKNPKSLAAFEKQAENSRAIAREADEACEGIAPEQVRARGHWLYRAAELGDAKSALEFGKGTFLQFEPLTHLDEVAFWREHAQSMLERAAEGGQRDAFLYLASGHDVAQERWIDGPRFDPDPVAAYAYYTALSLASDRIDVQVEGALDRLDRELSDADRARAREQAAAICANDLPLVCGPDAPVTR